ncbi:MAG TPA: RNA polymerase sigma factor [Thermoanaerobaculia bacterium]|nr:RNA polymerase sigma factor [Thermoanaerobaculia bacterium]
MPGASPAPSDFLLLSRIAEGDLEAFHSFYGRYAGRVLAYVRQLGRNREGAEDVVQEVFVAVWRRAASFRADRGDPAGWLYTITRNKLVDLWRRQGEGVDLGEMSEPADPAQERGELRLAMHQALARVAPEQRRAIEMAYFGGLTYEETARRLDLPVGTLKSRIRSGLRSLRTVLEGS